MLIYRKNRKRRDGLQPVNAGGPHYALLVALMLGLPGISPQALGTMNLHDHGAIREAAASFLADNPPKVRGRIETSIGRLDPRLRLARCDRALEVTRTPGSRPVGRTTLEIRCSSPKPWKLLLPVNLRVFGSVVAAARTLPRGTVLRKDDLALQEQELSRLGYGYVADLEDAIGKELRRAVRAGATFSPNQLAAERLVQRGQRVTILANAGGIEVRMVGEALADGSRDELIRVRNRKTKRIVEGVVESHGVVRVTL